MSIDAFIALNRFGLGAAPGDLGRVSGAPKEWLRAQVIQSAATAAHLNNRESSADIVKAIYMAQRQDDKAFIKEVGNRYRENYRDEIAARLRNHIVSNTPFAERMVMFWSNHFTISRERKQVGPVAPAFEREAIRPHVFGRFEDMLKASTQHVGMLIYLDNIVSIGANSFVGKKRKKNINENLAREILELHTLGVNGGYTQTDVVEFAKALTGWTIAGLRRNKKSKRQIHGGFGFEPSVHEPGPKYVLGKKYSEKGHQEGLDILKDLARHPSTAKFVATKLARHFVADDPPKSAVIKLEETFLKTNGDLAAMSLALIELEEIWQEPLAKVKTPYELLISVSKITRGAKINPKLVYKGLMAMNHIPFSASSPEGWPDNAEFWIAPEALMKRIQWIRTVSSQLNMTLNPLDLLQSSIAPVASPEVIEMIRRASSEEEGVALLMASSEFQRR